MNAEINLPFVPRPSQARILDYSGGRLGVAAVPGSGKTHVLSALAATLIARGGLSAGQEILVVTLVNSAVDNFTARITTLARELDLIPDLGYRVRTLHGLAHDIVRENPPLAGLDKQFSIVDESMAAAMVRDATRAWMQTHSEVRNHFLRQDLPEGDLSRITGDHWPELTEAIAASFIRAAKDRLMSPTAVQASLENHPQDLPLARMCAEIYGAYQKALAHRGAVDFDDLIRLAAHMLEQSPDLLGRLRYRWPFVLEDEAQDSSLLQQRILGMLAGSGGNWVRVGDPNQAIFETFTTADPELLKAFIAENPNHSMPESGRCQPSIITLANQLIGWSTSMHPVKACRNALSVPYIEPAPLDDSQPNPPENPAGIVFVGGALAPNAEVQYVASSLGEWLPQHRNWTVAVLSPTNDHAANVVKALQARGIPCRELLRSTSPTRAVAGAISGTLAAIVEPGSPAALTRAYRVWRRDWRADAHRRHLVAMVANRIAKFRRTELFLGASEDVLVESVTPVGAAENPGHTEDEATEVLGELGAFQRIAARWHLAASLPVDQLVLVVAQDIFADTTELALAHKLALVMRQLADENHAWRLPELLPQLTRIAKNERKFIGFSADDTGFEPDAYPGEVVVATVHKAKGLEWDRVYITSLNDYDFPSGLPGENFVSEKWFIRDGLNLEAEALAQLDFLEHSPDQVEYREGEATREARINYARERLRLMFVGITRARKELILLSNTGKRGTARPAVAFVALEDWWAQTQPT